MNLFYFFLLIFYKKQFNEHVLIQTRFPNMRNKVVNLRFKADAS